MFPFKFRMFTVVHYLDENNAGLKNKVHHKTMRASSKTCHPPDGLSFDSADVNYSTRNIMRVSNQICILHSYKGVSSPRGSQRPEAPPESGGNRGLWDSGNEGDKIRSNYALMRPSGVGGAMMSVQIFLVISCRGANSFSLISWNSVTK